MQTTKHLRRLGKALALLLSALFVDMALSYALCPLGSITEVTWYDYRQAVEKDFDTVVIGSSYAQLGINPFALDEELGSNAYNLATLGQSLPDSLAALQTAAHDHDLHRVVLCCGIESFRDTPQYDRQICFLQAKSVGESLLAKAQNAARVAFDADNFPNSKSLTWVFPWMYNTVPRTYEAISANVQSRLDGQTPLEASETTESGWRYLGKGYGGYDDTFDFQRMSTDLLSIPGNAPLEARHLEELAALLDFCTQQNITAYVVMVPQPDYMNLAHHESWYPQLLLQAQQIVEEHGGRYMDANLIDPRIYRPLNTDFRDAQHLNIDGAARFSTALGRIIARCEGGEDIRPLFSSYDDWDAHIDSLKDIALCYCDYKVGPDAIEFVAGTVAKPDAKIEYQFETAAAQAKRYEIAQPFGTSYTFEAPISGHGKLKVLVTARVAGQTSDEDACIWRGTVVY
ncbi:MAG: hypothetical protein IKG18_02245 [Atopobiaceae bacterium]|nr:hypothetical protein [Atopobiaceae bacterium]